MINDNIYYYYLEILDHAILNLIELKKYDYFNYFI